MTRRETAARNRRDLHERRIAAQSSLLRKIAWAWAWVYAELRTWVAPWGSRRKPAGRAPDVVLSEVLDDVVAIAARLNEEGARR